MAKIFECQDSQSYDLIVVGSGNGACAFLHQYLNCSTEGRVLVLEEGENFFETSDITHQRNWAKSYSDGNIFKLHQAQTSDRIPILSGRACTMGGGGSINYTTIFESSKWLAEHLGRDPVYWDAQKAELAKCFRFADPTQSLTDVAKHVKEKLENIGFSISDISQDSIPTYVDGKDRQIHIFPTQFDEFGQRTRSGVSLVNWYLNQRLDFMTQQRVTKLHLEATDKGQRCRAISVFNSIKGKLETYHLGSNTKLLLCAGAATPQLLYEHREKLNNLEIGKHVNDHILLPFGIYVLNSELEVTLKDQYVSLFATTEAFSGEGRDPTICNFDFFSGRLNLLLYFISHLFLAFWLPNWLKLWMTRNPDVFQWLKRATRFLVTASNWLVDSIWRILHFAKLTRPKWNLISAIVKFNIAREGYYEPLSDRLTQDRKYPKPYRIVLRCFEDKPLDSNPDFQVAKDAISKHICLMESLGAKPHPIFQFAIRLLTRMPYDVNQVERYINHYSRYDLLTEQHLSGGCVFGKAIDSGLESPQDTGKVFGSENIYVADLSASPLPRISPQMTAYLIGHHVATQICQDSTSKAQTS
ncbi:GMC oxidoreductase [Merismopedia glauca]|uniref:Choline dehydrogenase n=1 Tax=Merismopedia glauca CCAP 1448/3 TaxID=1296344 RepID=A0A2T1C258_9CYAN|nr:GMC oxidoreductase [Merismopedia glauca]PSB02365.1 choline dehydrogenase [Merismopedia glauca CCAP 1448/3]